VRERDGEREREREEFPVLDAHNTPTLGLTTKASSKIKTIMITKDRKAMCCECEKKSKKVKWETE